MIFQHCRTFCYAACTGLVFCLPFRHVQAADVRHEAILKKGSAEWNAMRQKEPALQPDLSGAAIRGRRLRKVDFRHTNLAGADISQTDLGKADFGDADLHGARLDGSVLAGSRFADAKMQRASLTGASCSDADFNGAQMASSVLRRVDFESAILRGADLSGADLREANLEHADLREADLRAANLWLARAGSVNFNGAVISDETVLPNGKTGSADWAGAHGALFISADHAPEDLPESRSEKAPEHSALPADTAQATSSVSHGKNSLAETLKPVKAWRPSPSVISYDADQLDLLKSNVMKWNRMRAADPAMIARLEGAPLSNRVLAYADLHGARLEKALLRNSDLERADFSGADLREADLRSTNLQKTDFRQTDLRGAKLWLANTGRAQFSGAIVSSETVLDNGKKATRSWAAEHAARFSDDPVPVR
jgi:uncharacterized protein YjbI with pentapeptide repeats